MSEFVGLVSERGDLAHITLFLWSLSSTSMLLWALKALLGSARRFDDFINEIRRLNATLRDDEWK
ncbi:hypothetical protein [Flexibacterium corallicola]|uniref:hypothetical protein n=1 Tax=Flexibacterium corallicola TaxID=3037259 RepID=UPI00286EFF9D|nr:hypothetical protein [Pseudovibrio sp. M1P-2-3]